MKLQQITDIRLQHIGEVEFKSTQQRRSDILQTVTLSLIAIVTVSLVFSLLLFFFFDTQLHPFMNVGLPLIDLTLWSLVLYLNRRGYAKQAAYGLCFGFYLATFGALLSFVTINGVDDTLNTRRIGHAYLMGLSILLAAMLINPVAAFGFAMLNTISFLLLFYWVAPTYIFGGGVLFLFWWFLAVISWLYEDTLSKAFDHLKSVRLHLQQLIGKLSQRTQQLEEKTAELAEKNFLLEQEINERQRAEAQKVELEKQLYQAQKMEALGRLAGGVAHDFNNLLTIIIGYSEYLLLDKNKTVAEIGDDLEQIKKAGDQAKSLTSQLLAFSRKQAIQPKLFDLNVTITNTQKMLRRLIGADVELVTTLEPKLSYIKADMGQLEQVLLNLAVNARDAMPQGGILTIKTESVTISNHNGHHQSLSLKPGAYISLTVSDTGIGMDKETQTQIFEPFFTTKALGKGTGLGLATVHGIVKQNNGDIEVISTLGRGTSFKIYLPQTDTPQESNTQPTSHLPKLTQTATILLVEDQAEVRSMAYKILSNSGYQVLVSENGVEAQKLAQTYQRDIDLLITDIVMPHLSGQQLAEQLCQTRPMLKVLFMSGYTGDTISDHGDLPPTVHILEKPFTATELVTMVRQVLELESVADS